MKVFHKQIITPTDLKVINAAVQDVLAAEPTAVISMISNGKGSLYRYLVEECLLKDFPFAVIYLNAIKEEQLDPFLKVIRKQKGPTLVVAHLTVGKDISWFINELEALRKEKAKKFTTLIFANLRETWDALALQRKLLSGSLYIMKPLNLEEADYLLTRFETIFQTTLPKAQKQAIIELSGGHRGLIKAIFLGLKNNPDLKLALPSLLNCDSVVFRLQEIAEELGEERLEQLLRITSASHYLERYGYIKNGAIFTSLLTEYIRIYSPHLIERVLRDKTLNFTPQEMIVFNLLKQNINKVVKREVIAQAIWEQDWEEKYSDWAIDMLIYRIRSKIKSFFPEYRLQTKRGSGFILLSSN